MLSMKKLDCRGRAKLVRNALLATSTAARKARSVDEYSKAVRGFSVLLEHFMERDDNPTPGVKIDEQNILEGVKTAHVSIPEVRELLEHIAEESRYESVRDAVKKALETRVPVVSSYMLKEALESGDSK